MHGCWALISILTCVSHFDRIIHFNVQTRLRLSYPVFFLFLLVLECLYSTRRYKTLAKIMQRRRPPCHQLVYLLVLLCAVVFFSLATISVILGGIRWEELRVH